MLRRSMGSACAALPLAMPPSPGAPSPLPSDHPACCGVPALTFLPRISHAHMPPAHKCSALSAHPHRRWTRRWSAAAAALPPALPPRRAPLRRRALRPCPPLRASCTSRVSGGLLAVLCRQHFLAHMPRRGQLCPAGRQLRPAESRAPPPPPKAPAMHDPALVHSPMRLLSHLPCAFALPAQPTRRPL